MDRNLLKGQIQNAFESFKTAIRKHANINKKRADGGWTVGEIGNHIIKSSGVNFGRTKKTDRAYDKNAAAIRNLFLDFNVKFTTAPELEPEEIKYSLPEILTTLDHNEENLLRVIDKEDLTETCTDIELPVWGQLTKYEWLILIENHIIRHTHQIEDFNSMTSSTH